MLVGGQTLLILMMSSIGRPNKSSLNVIFRYVFLTSMWNVHMSLHAFGIITVYSYVIKTIYLYVKNPYTCIQRLHSYITCGKLWSHVHRTIGRRSNVWWTWTLCVFYTFQFRFNRSSVAHSNYNFLGKVVPTCMFFCCWGGYLFENVFRCYFSQGSDLNSIYSNSVSVFCMF